MKWSLSDIYSLFASILKVNEHYKHLDSDDSLIQAICSLVFYMIECDSNDRSKDAIISATSN